MKDNMIVQVIRDEGAQGVVKVLLRMNEEIMEMQKTIKAMAEAFTALANVQTMLNGVADEMNEKINQLTKRDGDVRSTREMIDDN